GQTARDPNATTGIRSVAVFGFVYPAPTVHEAAPNTYAMANVQECAGSHGLPRNNGPYVGPNGYGGWEVNFDPGAQGGGHVAGASLLVIRQPGFDERMGLKPNKCARGWLTFEVDGIRPFYVTFDYPYTYWRVGS